MSKEKTYYIFEATCVLSDLAQMKAHIQPVKTLETIRYKLAKEFFVTHEEIVENKKIHIKGIVGGLVSNTEKIHEYLTYLFKSFDEQSTMTSKWKNMKDVELDTEHLEFVPPKKEAEEEKTSLSLPLSPPL